jgi:hypothetical protein
VIIRLVLLVVFIAVVLILIQQYKSSRPLDRKRLLWKYGLPLAAIVLILLAITGRIHWIGALIAALIPVVRQSLPLILRSLPFLQQLRQQKAHAGTGTGSSNETITALLKMRYDPQSQQLSGEVIAGPFAGRQLEDLSLPQLQMLLEYCQAADSNSARLLITYLNQRFGNQWQQSPQSSSQMNKEEAYALLGLTAATNREEIIKAHRKLMQKVHPDRGGNDYLAAKINEAKELLLKVHPN